MTKPLGVRGEAGPRAVWREETVLSSKRTGGGGRGDMGKSGNHRPKDQPFLLPLPPPDPAEHWFSLHLPDPRCSTALAQDRLSYCEVPRGSPEVPCQRAAAGPPGASSAGSGRTSWRRRPRPCSLRWRAGAGASCLEVSTLKTAHLSDGSSTCSPLGWPGLGHTWRGGVPYNRDGKYHSSLEATLISGQQLPP